MNISQLRAYAPSPLMYANLNFDFNLLDDHFEGDLEPQQLKPGGSQMSEVQSPFGYLE